MKRLIVWALSLLLALSPAAAQMTATGIGGGGFGAPAGGGCTAATNFLARTSGLSGTETSAYTTMICGLVTDSIITGNLSGATGCGAVLDGLYIFATNTTTTANLNLCGTSFGLTQTGSITFTADQGYTGDGLTGYLDTGFVPSSAGGNYALNSASLGIYVQNNRTLGSTAVDMGASNVAAGDISYMRPRNASNAYEGDMNAASYPTVANTTAQGQWINSRTGSSNFVVYNNGSSFSTLTSASANLSPSSIFIFAYNQSAGGATPVSLSADKLSAAYMGAGLNGTQAANLMSRINAFMTALGINVY